MQLYAAPLEGVSGFAWRKAHAAVFGGADKYYAPFISPTEHRSFTAREIRDLSQNESNLVPQILANNAENFAWAANELGKLGYSEVNLNLGCPSGTVVSKKKGAGLLEDLSRLDTLLDEMFERVNGVDVSVKTRIGVSSVSEWTAILAIFEKYPISELIVHPRVRTQMYNGMADRELFLETLQNTGLKLVYNGDVMNTNDSALEYGVPVMVGRGLISRPSLFREIKGGEPPSKDELGIFHALVMDGYSTYISGNVQLLHKMKEFWNYYQDNFDVPQSMIKKIFKAKTLADYESAVSNVLR